MSLKPPQHRIHPFLGTDTDDEYGALSFLRSDSSVVSEQPDPWVCSQCSYVNGDGRNISCAMCGTKDSNKVREESKEVEKQSQPWRLLVGGKDVGASLTQGDRRHSITGKANPSQTKRDNTMARSVSLRVPLNGPRPGMEDEDADDEAPPSKPSTGRSAYCSHQILGVGQRKQSFLSDDSSVTNASVSSSIATVASAMNNSVDSNKSAMNSSVASSTATMKASNTRQVSIPPHWESTPTRSNSKRATSTRDEELKDQVPESCPPSIFPTSESISKSRSGMDSIDEEQRSFVPPSMRSMSHQSFLEVPPTTRSESAIQSSRSEHAASCNETIRPVSPPQPMVRKESNSSHFTDCTSVRTSVLSTYNDEPSGAMELGEAFPEQKSNPDGAGDDDCDASSAKQAGSRKCWLIVLGFVILLISIILMATLIPQQAGEGRFIVPSLSRTQAPTASTFVFEDTPNVVNSAAPRPSLLPSSSPSSSPSISDGIRLLGKVHGYSDNDRIGNSVSIGGPGGTLVAFVGNGKAGVAEFDAVEKTWSTIDFLNTLFPVTESAQVSLSTETDRLALAYDGKLEIHEYSPSLGKWIGVKVVGEESVPTVSNRTTSTIISGNGEFVAFVPPITGIQMLRYNENLNDWIYDPIVTESPPDGILQVDVSHDGTVLAVLTETGVEIMALISESNLWVNVGNPITDIKLAVAISLSGDGGTLAVTSRSQTVLYSLSGIADKSSLFVINQGGVDISLSYRGDFLALGSSSQMNRSSDLFSSVTVFQRTVDEETSKEFFEFVGEKNLFGDSLGASLSVLNSDNGPDERTFLAVGAPMDGRKMEGSLRFYQVRRLVTK